MRHSEDRVKLRRPEDKVRGRVKSGEENSCQLIHPS